MTCPCCHRPEPTFYTPTGIWNDLRTNAPIAIAYVCKCGTNRSQYWGMAIEPMRAAARLAEMGEMGGVR